MIKLREAVYTADKSGTDIQAPLKALQAYVTRHMNTDLSSGQSAVYPPIQLKYTYDRLVKANADKFAQNSNQQQVYSDAQAYCEKQNSTDFSGRNRVPCITQYVTDHGGKGLQLPAAIPDSLYKFSFASPRWSPDLAGWSMAVAILSGLLFIVTAIGRRLFR
jgi:hypothetical protein